MFRKLQFVLLLSLIYSSSVFAQSRTIEGVVSDAETGEAIVAASIQIEGTTRGTTTNIDGEYSLEASTGDVLIFSFLGYIPKRVTVADQNTIDVQLAPDVQMLEDVVVTGYTTESRDKITGSISTITNQSLESVPLASFDQILQGKSPGLYITSGSGQPGSAATVRIRGSASITGSSTPLYVVDGVPINSSDFATLNPSDFESVSVLKDASATAVYGSRGSNGVIVVTTKRGQSNQSEITYSGQYGVSTVGEPNFDMMNTEQKLEFEEILRGFTGWAISPDNPANAGVDPAVLEEQRQELIAQSTDWEDVFFRNGITQNHQLSFAGGNDRTRYYVSGSMFDQQGVGLRSALERYTLRLNLDANVSDNITVGFNGQGGYSESTFIESENGVALSNPFAAVYLANPYEKLFDEDGNILSGGGKTGANAYDRTQNDENRRNEIKFVGKGFINYDISDFRFGTNLSLDYRERDFDRWINPTSYAGQLVSQGGSGLLSKSNNRATRIVSLTTAEYINTFDDIHTVNVFLGNEFIKQYFDSFGYTGYGLSDKLGSTPASITPGSPDNGLIPGVGGGISDSALWSLFGIIDYSYDNKYNLKASVRRDGSSRFGEANQYALLWSLGGSWVATNEDFMSDIDYLDRLVVRASYGKTGNQLGIGNYQRVATFSIGSYVGNSTIVPSSPGNDDLKWETTKKANLGFDFAVLDNRVTGTVDLYNEATEDLFINQSLSRTSGFTSLEVNAGSMRNRGVELSLQADVYRSTNAIISVNGNYSYNQNEITDLGQVDEFELGTSIIKEGLPLGTHYVVGWAGVDPATGAPLYYDGEGNVTTQFSGDFSQATFGTWLPPRTGGFGVDASYKNFSLRSQFTFASGYTRFNNQSFFNENHGFAGFNQRTVMLDIWQEPGDITDIQSNQYARQFSSKDLEDASYLRFRNLMVSYRIPGSVFNNQVSGVRLFVQGQNLYTWTKFTGFDPEDSNNIAQYEYPTPRIFTTGIDINF
ncbi:SusC/RagA family TonB-linked outer membrane protein [Gracilimonas sp.]|uniref:SusC/RagA family TonB-linked outer membrane protein n=1 Tax=Gracilimonas sp. TaxID=1974203 RepID=UPI002871E4D4|nr:TonB-dependent receptor [Gracilimonas sp.]